MNLLAGDLGGTKTLLRLFTDSDDILREKRYDSENHAVFDEILADFLGVTPPPIRAACFAVAGPVLGTTAKITNLPWVLDSRTLEATHRIEHVRLVNDFYGVAASLTSLNPDDLLIVNRGKPDATAPRVVIGAGTGLGEAIVSYGAGKWTIIPSEGGHCDFAPANELQDELLVHLRAIYGHVSWERVVSGMGIVDLYAFLRKRSGNEDAASESAAEIAALADDGDREAAAAMDLFIDGYGAEAGNLALKALARGGVYIAGGIAMRNPDRMTDGRFLRAFTAKGRFSDLMKTLPVFLITNSNAGVLGAGNLAQETVTP